MSRNVGTAYLHGFVDAAIVWEGADRDPTLDTSTLLGMPWLCEPPSPIEDSDIS